MKYSPEIIAFIKENADKGYDWLICQLKIQHNIEIKYLGLYALAARYQLKIRRYSDETLQFIKDNAVKGYKWLSDKTGITMRNLQEISYDFGIHIKRYMRGYDGYVYDFVHENFDKYSHNELTNLINEKFNINTTPKRVAAFCKNAGLVGYDHNNFKLPIGSEKTFKNTPRNKNAYYKIMIKYRNLPSDKINTEYKINWKPKTHYVWEQYHGEIPKGYCIIQLDGDYKNCDISNLRLVSQSVMSKISKHYGYGIVTEALVEILKLEEEINNAINN